VCQTVRNCSNNVKYETKVPTNRATKGVRTQWQYEAASTDSVTDHVGSSMQAEAATMD
jgi:hypothetical protein